MLPSGHVCGPIFSMWRLVGRADPMILIFPVIIPFYHIFRRISIRAGTEYVANSNVDVSDHRFD